jgi:hypothetical protein
MLCKGCVFSLHDVLIPMHRSNHLSNIRTRKESIYYTHRTSPVYFAQFVLVCKNNNVHIWPCKHTNISAVDLLRSEQSPVYGLDNRGIGVQYPTRATTVLSSTASTPALGITQPPTRQLQPGCGGVFPQRVKRLGCETDHSPPSTILSRLNDPWSRLRMK